MPPTAHLAKYRKLAQDKRDERILRTAEFMATQTSQPLTADEVAVALGYSSEATARTDLKFLAAEGLLSSKEETREEREVRYGGTARAKPSMLYSPLRTVPARTQRVVVPGAVATPAENTSTTGARENDSRMWCKMKKYGPRKKFTAYQLSEESGVGIESMRKRLRKMVADGCVVHAGIVNRQTLYSISNKDRVREFLNQPTDFIAPTPPPAPVAPTTVVVNVPPASVTDQNVVVRRIIEENKQLRARVAELESEVSRLRVPGLDPTLLAELDSWTPAP